MIRISKYFPIVQWLPNYELDWLTIDVLTGITIGMISIPQSMGYAKVVGVPLQHGLYSSFIGVFAYQFFATAKDVTVGPSAVLSQLTGQLLASALQQDPTLDPVMFVVAVNFIAGCFEFLFGILNLGILVDLISSPVIMGFTTGAAIQTIFSQMPGMLGIKVSNNNGPVYQVIGDLFKNIKQFDITGNAGFGLGTLLFLYLWTGAFKRLENRGHKWAMYVAQSGNFISIITTILISFQMAQNGPLRHNIVGDIPSGLNYIRFPTFTRLDLLFPAASSVFIIALLEHISIAKGFGRLNGYKVDPNQETLAMGLVNISGSMIGAIPTTGSFSRSAIKSKMGVKTPSAGVFAGIVILTAIFVLVSKFYFMPSSVLNAIITFALLGLINSPKEINDLWRVKKTDAICFITCVVVILVGGFQLGLYIAIGLSLLFMLYEIARPKINILFKTHDEWIGMLDNQNVSYSEAITKGLGIFKFEKPLTYINAAHQCQLALDWVEENCRQEKDVNAPRLWNEPKVVPVQSNLPPLRGVIFDLSACTEIDSTGFQNLLTLCQQFFKFAGWQIPIYFVNVRRGIKRVVHKLHKRFERSRGEEIDLEAERRKRNEVCGCVLVKDSLDDALDALQKGSNATLQSDCKGEDDEYLFEPYESKFNTLKSQ